MNVTGLPNAHLFFVHDEPDGMSAAVTNRIADLETRASTARRVFQECGAVTL